MQFPHGICKVSHAAAEGAFWPAAKQAASKTPDGSQRQRAGVMVGGAACAQAEAATQGQVTLAPKNSVPPRRTSRRRVLNAWGKKRWPRGM